MRIAMLHVDLPTESRGGVAHQVSRLSDTLARRGHEVTVFTMSPSPPDVAYDIRRIPLRGPLARRPSNLVTAPIAFALGRYGAFDVVHAHGDSQLLLRRRPPVVRTFYGSARDEARSATRLRRKVAQRGLFFAELAARRNASFTTGISRATEDAVGRLDRIIPCGVDLERFHPGSKSPHPSILFVGTLDGRKRGRLLIEVFQREIRTRIPDCELWLVADADVDAEGVRCYRGASDELVARLFREAWVFALPSTYEGFGVPYVEAMASGTPPVATLNAGATEIFAPGSGGTMTSDSDLGSVIVALLRDDERRARLVADALRTCQTYEWGRVADAYEQIYDSVVARR